MANDINKIAGTNVTYRELPDGNLEYYFTQVTIRTNTTPVVLDDQTYTLCGINQPQSNPIRFGDITDKKGAVNIAEYIQALAQQDFFFEALSIAGGNVKFITALGQLPAPSGGIIDLGNNGILYYFAAVVDCEGNTVRFGNNALKGTSQELAGLSNAILDVDATCTLSDIKFDTVSMSIDAVEGAFDWENVNFFNSSNINIINAANAVWEKFGFINTYNVQITGTVDSFVLSPNSIFRNITEPICDMFAVRATAVINRRIRIEDSVFASGFATQNPIVFEAGATIGIESFIMKTVRFTGLGSIQGINGGDDIASFRDCVGDGVINSTSIATMYISNNLTDTPTPIAGDKYKVVGTTQLGVVRQRFAHDAVGNTLEYTSSISRIFRIQIPYTVFAGVNNVVGCYVAITRAGNIETPNTDVILESEMYTTTNGTRPEAGMVQCIQVLNQGDKVYFAVENETGTTVRVNFMNMIIETANV